MGRKPREMRLLFVRRSSGSPRGGEHVPDPGRWTALGLCLSSYAGAGPDPDNAPRIYHKARNFRIPFNLNASGKDRIKELHLLVSEDYGYHWRVNSKTYPEQPVFTFRSSHDGEYWFAVQTRTVDGSRYRLRSRSRPIQAEHESRGRHVSAVAQRARAGARRGSLATVRWEVKDENVNLKSLVLEYQTEGANSWRRGADQHAQADRQPFRWDAGTAESLKVRASVSDHAGNVSRGVPRPCPEGTASPPDLASGARGTLAIRRQSLGYPMRAARRSRPGRVSHPSRTARPQLAVQESRGLPGQARPSRSRLDHGCQPRRENGRSAEPGPRIGQKSRARASGARSAA